MLLSKENIKHIQPQPGLIIPDERVFALPEKVLQFGTGVLLRGLPDYFIDKANRQGIFNGRIVVVKSTNSGSTDDFANQDGLYTLCIRGIEQDNKIEETVINSSISRVLSAATQWAEIMICAHNPAMQVIISNTTEVGIVASRDDIKAGVPASFPGKLLAFLYERYTIFRGTAESGMVIVPAELITDNGARLRSIVLELAQINNLEEDFIQWLKDHNHFCNSLVDRIVPGKLPAYESKALEAKLGYTDNLMIMTESFRLWAIESDNQRVKEALSFQQADAGLIVTPDIEKFRELKLRLLNGTHTFACGLAVLSGFDTVKEAMLDEHMAGFIRRLMMLEVATALEGEILSYNEACAFANTVLDRFRNPFLDHHWLSITLNFTSKMRLRNIPLLLRHHQKTTKVPEHMALGFAAYLFFMKCRQTPDGQYKGSINGKEYPVQDDNAAYFSQAWKENTPGELVHAVLADHTLWGADLTTVTGFESMVREYLSLLIQEGALAVISNRQLKKSIA